MRSIDMLQLLKFTDVAEIVQACACASEAYSADRQREHDQQALGAHFPPPAVRIGPCRD